MDYKGIDSPQRRLRHYRELEGLTLREFAAAVNRFLPEIKQVTHATVSNYEVSTRPGPRVEWLAALKKAFPDLRLEWVATGVGAMTVVGEQWRQAPTDEQTMMLTAKSNWQALPHGTHSVFEELLGALIRTADGAVPMHLQLFAAEQIGDHIYAPFGRWGYLTMEEVSTETLRVYATSVLNALTLIVAEANSASVAELEEAQEAYDDRKAQPKDSQSRD